MSEGINIEGLTLGFGQHEVVKDLGISLGQGQIGCLLGASGCGKTTILRAIAGFEVPWSGSIDICGQRVGTPDRQLPVEKRKVGMVFQDYALFPHLNVAKNIGFGLSGSKDAVRQRVLELAEVFAIEDIIDEYPHRLSGGQQQRVAVARAIAPRPRILLLDEPFASLDVELREQVAREVRMILKQDAMTTLLVSHNQQEAFAMADEIGVIGKGRLLQWGSSFDLYHRPVCSYVADFVGDGVFLQGRVLSRNSVDTELGVIKGTETIDYAPGSLVSVLLRPDDIVHDDSSEKKAVVIEKVFRGAAFLYTLALESGARVLSLVSSHHDHGINEHIGIRLEIDHLVVFPSRPGE